MSISQGNKLKETLLPCLNLLTESARIHRETRKFLRSKVGSELAVPVVIWCFLLKLELCLYIKVTLNNLCVKVFTIYLCSMAFSPPPPPPQKTSHLLLLITCVLKSHKWPGHICSQCLWFERPGWSAFGKSMRRSGLKIPQSKQGFQWNYCNSHVIIMIIFIIIQIIII